MKDQAQGIRFGPLWLAPGITRTNVVTKFFTAFVSVAMLSGTPILTGYLLTEHLGIPRGQTGTVAGELSFWVELVAIFLFNPFGVLADRIGRRPVFMMGILAIGLGFGLSPFATTVNELLFFRLIYAVGMAATAGTMATLTSDYPREDSRGLMVGITSIMNTLGAMFVAGVLARIPTVLADRGYDAITGGKAIFLVAAGMCVFAALAARFGLAPGTPVAKKERSKVSTLLKSGVHNARNPRIALAYAGAFAARSDLVIKGMFFTLWAIQDGFKQGMNPGESMARFGIMLLLMSSVGIASAPIFGYFIDRVNRLTAFIVALVFATVGYSSMAFITSPLDFAMWPFFVVITWGSGFMMKSSLSLIGQEAPIKQRGSVIATFGMFGAIGILVFSRLGGIAFDEWGPWAPFVLAGAYQGALLILATIVRIVAPGQPAPKPFKKRVATASEVA
jgi:MFS family permease